MYISKELLITCASEFGVQIDNEAADKFDKYASLLVNYNEKVNLTAVTDPDDIVIKHFGDSLALIKYGKVNGSQRLADIGTGAGFPGVPVLIAKPGIKLTLFDSVNKKLDFLRFLANEIDIKPEIVHMRAEDAGNCEEYREKFDITCGRAVVQLRILSEFCLPLTKVGGKFCAMKGDISKEEKEPGIKSFSKLGGKLYEDNFYNIHNGDKRNMIIAKKISQTSSKYPRNMSRISKNPL